MPRTRRPTLGHRFQYATYRAVETVLRVLSVRSCFRAGAGLARLAFPLCAPLKRVVLRNLRFAFGDEKSGDEISKLAREVFQNTTGNLLCSIRVPFLADRDLRELVTIENLELLEQSVEDGKGTVFLVPHMGNWELLAQLTTIADLPVEMATHYRPLNNSLMNRLIERRRKRRGLRLFPKKTSSHTLSKFLRENGILGILADQRIPSRGALCPFFGRPTTCSPLPALLARRTGARLLGIQCTTVRDDHWKLTITPVDGIDSAACAANLEGAWRSSPADVFWFQDRWKLPRTHPLRGLARPPFPDESSITKPLRLVALHSSTEAPPERPDFSFPDYLLTWETRECDNPASITPDDALTVDLFVTDAKITAPTCPCDKLLPAPHPESR